MKDILKRYKKHKKISNIWVLVTSLVLAIGINLLMIDWSNLWNIMKANVLEVKLQNEQSDIYTTIKNWEISLISNKDIDNKLLTNKASVLQMWLEPFFKMILLHFLQR